MWVPSIMFIKKFYGIQNFWFEINSFQCGYLWKRTCVRSTWVNTINLLVLNNFKFVFYYISIKITYWTKDTAKKAFWKTFACLCDFCNCSVDIRRHWAYVCAFYLSLPKNNLCSKVIQDAQVIQDSSYSLQGCMSFWDIKELKSGLWKWTWTRNILFYKRYNYFYQCENEKLVTIKRTRQLGNTKKSFFRAYATL